VHRGRAVCSAVAGMTSGCSAAAVEPIDRLRTICVLPKSGARDRETSETDQIRKTKIDKTKIGEAWILRGTCEIDGRAPLHAIVVLAA
jgi:hypothetical protein